MSRGPGRDPERDESGDEIIQLAAVAVETAGKHGEMDPAADCLGSAGWFG